MTAHDVVNRVRRLTGIKQVGHAGTLDPMARGVLPVAIGRACRLLRFLQDDKVYLASVLFGVSTDTDDIEGRVLQSRFEYVAREAVEEALAGFSGEIEQLPPLYSAIHVGGKRLYELARKGEAPEQIPKRKVLIHKAEPLDYVVSDAASFGISELEKVAVLSLRVHCSTGTYIRSIARDLGQMLGLPACLSSLLRERVGSFDLATSFSLESLTRAKEQGKFSSLIERPEAHLHLPCIELNDEEARRLSCGQRLAIAAGRINEVSEHLLVFHAEKLIAVSCLIVDSKDLQSDIVELKPLVVLNDGSAQ